MLAQAANETLERHKATQQEVLQAMAELENAKAVLAQHREDEIRFKTEAARAARDVETETANLASLRDEKESAAEASQQFLAQTADSAQQKTEETDAKFRQPEAKWNPWSATARTQCIVVMRPCSICRKSVLRGSPSRKMKESLENAVER